MSAIITAAAIGATAGGVSGAVIGSVAMLVASRVRPPRRAADSTPRARCPHSPDTPKSESVPGDHESAKTAETAETAPNALHATHVEDLRAHATLRDQQVSAFADTLAAGDPALRDRLRQFERPSRPAPVVRYPSWMAPTDADDHMSDLAPGAPTGSECDGSPS